MASIERIRKGLRTVKFVLEDIGAIITLKEPSIEAMIELEHISTMKYSKKPDSNESTKAIIAWYKENLPSLIVDHNFEDAKDNREVTDVLASDWESFIQLVSEYQGFLGSSREKKEKT